MALLKVARLGNPILRQKAKEVATGKIASDRIQGLIDSMIATMREEEGVGLAGPQVYGTEKIFVVEVAENSRYPEAKPAPLRIFINPKIVKVSKGKWVDWEGCLSIPGLRGLVPRHESVVIQAYDRRGKKFSLEASGFFGRVIQHEIDHLEGLMFIDRMTDFKSLTFLKEYAKYWQNGSQDWDLIDEKALGG